MVLLSIMFWGQTKNLDWTLWTRTLHALSFLNAYHEGRPYRVLGTTLIVDIWNSGANPAIA